MKALKLIAQIVGVIWMIVFALANTFTLMNQTFDFSSTYGLGYLFGMVLSMILLISIGYFIYRWGMSKPKHPQVQQGKFD
ncbi:hypothetical protein [Algoriphagus aquimarinus]|uniref:Uncharacterized protein n=1 Tax=Algoriphagus aquimarinus TaxID=237018 RepID=A0A1I1CCU6_9BACT|nr:hypothetical protein [Algoriphagus aquimarinus]SFB59826.1 hypothetical protein SAMN04489723_12720 [Algoriphagus aquimarinus]